MKLIKVIFNKFYKSELVHIITFLIPAFAMLFLAVLKELTLQKVILFGVFLIGYVGFEERAKIWKIIEKKYKNRKKTKASLKPKPSQFSLFFAAMLHEPKNREFVIADIVERFAKDVKKRGVKWAKCMLWRDNFVGLWAAIGAKAIKGLKWLGFGYLIEKFLLK